MQLAAILTKTQRTARLALRRRQARPPQLEAHQQRPPLLGVHRQSRHARRFQQLQRTQPPRLAGGVLSCLGGSGGAGSHEASDKISHSTAEAHAALACAETDVLRFIGAHRM